MCCFNLVRITDLILHVASCVTNKFVRKFLSAFFALDDMNQRLEILDAQRGDTSEWELHMTKPGVCISGQTSILARDGYDMNDRGDIKTVYEGPAPINPLLQSNRES